MSSKKTLVLGASENPNRYSNKAILKLRHENHEVVAIGSKDGKVGDVLIEHDKKAFEGIDTVTLYLNEENQKPYYEYLLNLKPKRIIFNPGTENFELEQIAKVAGIQTQEACTLVLLATGQY
jgi:uncharacterized protein